MPKVKYITKPEPSVPVNYLRALFAAYRKANGLNSEIVAERLHCAPETVRWQWAKPPKTWKIGQLMEYCDAMGIPIMEALEAAVK